MKIIPPLSMHLDYTSASLEAYSSDAAGQKVSNNQGTGHGPRE